MFVYFFSCESWSYFFFFFSSRRRHTRFDCDWSSDVCSSDLCDLLARPTPIRSTGRRPWHPARIGPSELDLQAVVGDRDAQRFTRSRDFLVTQGFAPNLGDAFVVVGWFVVEKHEVFHVGKLAQLDPDHVARVAPVLLYRHGFRERVHGVENHQVGVRKESRGAFDRIRDVQPVLGVGRIDDDPAITDESIAIGITGMALKLGRHAPSSDLIASARLEYDEFYRGPEAIKRYGETGRVLLTAKRFLEISVTAVNPNSVSGDVGGGEKRKAHDVVPVKVGLEHVEDVGLGRTIPGNYMVSEGAYAAPEIAQYMLVVTRIELHARGIASESVRNGKIKLRVDPGPRLFLRVETLIRRRDYRMGKLVPDRDRKSTRLNSSHSQISYAVFCLK